MFPQDPATQVAAVASGFVEQALPHPPQLFVSVASFMQAPLHGSWFAGQAHCPAVHEALVAQTFPHAPQFDVFVLGSTQVPPQVSPQTHIPATQTCPVPFLDTHAWSTAGSSSTIPSQSLSLPSQTSAVGVHWQTLLVWPSMAPQVQPDTQVDAVAQLVVHTFVPFPSGRHMPLGQSEFLLHGVPVAPV